MTWKPAQAVVVAVREDLYLLKMCAEVSGAGGVSLPSKVEWSVSGAFQNIS